MNVLVITLHVGSEKITLKQLNILGLLENYSQITNLNNTYKHNCVHSVWDEIRSAERKKVRPKLMNIVESIYLL